MLHGLSKAHSLAPSLVLSCDTMSHLCLRALWRVGPTPTLDHITVRRRCLKHLLSNDVVSQCPVKPTHVLTGLTSRSVLAVLSVSQWGAWGQVTQLCPL